MPVKHGTDPRTGIVNYDILALSVLSFSDVGSAARFLLIVGIIELDFAVLTRWTTE